MTRLTKRGLEREVADLHETRGELPVAGLITVMSTLTNGGEVRLIDPNRRIIEIDSDRYQLAENVIDVLERANS